MPEQARGEIQDALQSYLAAAYPDREALHILDLTRLGEGWESDLYAFRLEHGPAGARRREALVLRLYSGNHGSTKAAHEFKSLRQLHRAGYPVPQAHWLGGEQSPFGRPFVILERVPGEVLGDVMFGPSAQKLGELLSLFCGLLVQLHGLDWRLFIEQAVQPNLANPSEYFFFDRWLQSAHLRVQGSGTTGFLPALAWFESQRPDLACRQPAPVHLDFHPYNVLLRPDGSPCVIDWTGFDVSDPRFDLAWTLLLARSYLGKGLRDQILHEYERQKGVRVEGIEKFEAAACLRRLHDMAVTLSAGAERMGMRPGVAEAMQGQQQAYRRVYATFLDQTGVRIDEIEGLFKEWES